MLDGFRKNSRNVLLVALIGTGTLAGCASQNHDVAPKNQGTTPTSSIPPLALPGQAFSCVMDTTPKTLSDAGVSEAAEALSSTFHETPVEITTEARYGIATCQRSITADMAQTMGFVVGVENIDPSYTCVTWTAIYDNPAEAQVDSPTNHIGLVCVPQPQ
jgi:hypothetical protein